MWTWLPGRETAGAWPSDSFLDTLDQSMTMSEIQVGAWGWPSLASISPCRSKAAMLCTNVPRYALPYNDRFRTGWLLSRPPVQGISPIAPTVRAVAQPKSDKAKGQLTDTPSIGSSDTLRPHPYQEAPDAQYLCHITLHLWSSTMYSSALHETHRAIFSVSNPPGRVASTSSLCLLLGLLALRRNFSKYVYAAR